jgi:hypothetical protein
MPGWDMLLVKPPAAAYPGAGVPWWLPLCVRAVLLLFAMDRNLIFRICTYRGMGGQVEQ